MRKLNYTATRPTKRINFNAKANGAKPLAHARTERRFLDCQLER